jgi:hypothetical protein
MREVVGWIVIIAATGLIVAIARGYVTAIAAKYSDMDAPVVGNLAGIATVVTIIVVVAMLAARKDKTVR